MLHSDIPRNVGPDVLFTPEHMAKYPKFYALGEAIAQGRLPEHEIFWRDHVPWLKERGYELRPRYQPDWAPSWMKGPKIPFTFYEDKVIPPGGRILDALRTSDNFPVIFKQKSPPPPNPMVQYFPDHELAIITKFSTEPLASDPRNHCVRLIEILDVPDVEDMRLMAIPLLFDWEFPPFTTIGEAVDFLAQIFTVRVDQTHRNCKFNNIMMDAKPIQATSVHPLDAKRTRDAADDARYSTRTRNPVKYYWIDFDLSGEHDPATGPALVEPGYGGTRGVPEFAFSDRMCDPFAVDVWCLGNMVRETMTQGSEYDPKIQGLQFLDGLVADMTAADPAARPRMREVVARFSKLVAGLSQRKLRSRYAAVGENVLCAPFKSTAHWIRQACLAVQQVPAIPLHTDTDAGPQLPSQGALQELFKVLSELQSLIALNILVSSAHGLEYDRQMLPQAATPPRGSRPVSCCACACATHLPHHHDHADSIVCISFSIPTDPEDNGLDQRMLNLGYVMSYNKTGGLFSPEHMAAYPELYAARDAVTENRLSDNEIFWRDHVPWLKERGYELRPRYQSDWVASWVKNPKLLGFQEDEFSAPVRRVLDGLRTSDNFPVLFKQKQPLVSDSTVEYRPDHEIEIIRKFSTEPLASDPRNHCVRLIEILDVPDVENMRLMAIPLLFNWNFPPFTTIGEVIDFLAQIFTGLEFMHSHNVWHGDCKFNNIMMDAKPIQLTSVHPFQAMRTRDGALDARYSTRTRHPVKYYWIDFDLSGEHDPAKGPALVEPGYGGTRNVPEFGEAASPDRMCDPFAVDVWCLGNMIRQMLTQVRSAAASFLSQLKLLLIHRFVFLEGLVADMTAVDPAARPRMSEVVARFTKLAAGLSQWKLRSRYAQVGEFAVCGIFRSTVHWIRQARLAVHKVPAVPLHTHRITGPCQ
ncbi:hypothetical protein B0H15DRAFT_883449 [Mycena belliarum]|uniref:Protein kinase domain-containing protein n=1 Tax=Mycena belliarum TaxID=1033014 RepID=A0AAD6XW42_9AGAR|nr:hypothetical protein B0H15DRAFT_883449 [Mycena belliae]